MKLLDTIIELQMLRRVYDKDFDPRNVRIVLGDFLYNRVTEEIGPRYPARQTMAELLGSPLHIDTEDHFAFRMELIK